MKKHKKTTFKKFSEANRRRSIIAWPNCKKWSESDWCCALAGEVGELCNFIKKRNRRKGKNHKYSHLEDCKKEIGDIQAYLDLIAFKLGFSLEECAVDKFNEVSDRVNLDIKL